MQDSNLKKCPNCNSFVDKNDKFCKVCGHDFSKDEEFTSEGKTFEDFLLEASKSRNESKHKQKKQAKKESLIIEDNGCRQTSRKNLSEDTTDRLNAIELEDASLDEERKKAFEESEENFSNKYDYYDYEYDDDEDYRTVWIKRTLMAIVAVALVIAAVFGFNYIKPLFQQNLAERNVTKESVKSKFINSIDTKSSEEMISILKSSDNSLPFRNSDAKEFIDELNANPEYKNKIEKWLQEDIEQLKSNKSYKSKNPIRMSKDSEGYKILIDPIKLGVENPKNATLSIDDSSNLAFPGKKILTIESNGLTLRQNITISYFGDSQKINWDMVDLSKTIADYDISTGDKNYEIKKSNDMDCLVFINDKNTALTTDKFNDLGKKNLKQDKDTVCIVAKGKEGLLKSNTETIGWETWIRLHLND
ncbi:zinc ribbon domain-containing protein [uncultured Finegoldia sp.]|uniref:zinc ribbon domain-containing protein n=1 Tax=uncultured Finegoldia sp. TaxID=328009 RepID=UPI0026066F2E|nr:zinc ribbon domain-containing protein [uncultured Finegoldia sp.]